MVKNVLIASLLLITLSCISLLLVSGINFTSIFSDKVSQIVFDPSFLGSFLGALFSSSIALIVLFIQFNNQKKVRRQDEYRKYHKYINLFSIELEWYLDKITSEKIEKLVKSNNYINNKILRDSTVEIIKSIESIDDDVIIDDVFVRFATMKLILNEMGTILSEDLNGIENEEDENSVISSLQANRIILQQSSDEINKKLSEAKRELRIKE
ncbi:hypothetical protein [Sporosarcina sp. FSL K6-2383]|uniref:hypothetical protein n=1 Tax=Sporosarcina sp. FSL K6-2383 TaxID=2921556 RepID=UPI003159F092